MENQIATINEKKAEITNDSEYIAAFADGSVSELLTQGTVPHESEGNYVRIFGNDSDEDIQAKLGSLISEKKTYKVTVWNTKTDSDTDSYEFEAANDEAAIEELKSNLTPQEDGKSGKYELELFEDDRFVSSLKKDSWV